MVMPIGHLMKEHRTIERMIEVIRKKINDYYESKKIDPDFVDEAVDFIRTYADRLHHGKEEDILFKKLEEKELSDEHQKIMDELMEEHRWGRETVKKLTEANRRYRHGDEEASESIAENLHELANFYPGHIEKEDKHFFIPVMEYLSDEEKSKMIDDEDEFDRQFIHVIYEEKIKHSKAD